MGVSHVHCGDGHGLLHRAGVGHHFDAPGNHEIRHAAHDVGCAQIHRRDSRTTKTIEGESRCGGFPTRIEYAHPAHAGPLLANLGTATDHHVIHLGGVEIVSIAERSQETSKQALGMNFRE